MKNPDYFERNAKVAYFSMEIGTEVSIPTYSGGLGILAGDTLKSAADLQLPMVGVTLLYHQGYFSQKILEYGQQKEFGTTWDPRCRLKLLPVKAEIQIEGRTVKIQAWENLMRGMSGGLVPVYYLDTNLDENDPRDRSNTFALYSGDHTRRIAQEALLGIGGVRMLEALGYDQVETYHMNEGHAAFLTLELLRREKGYIDKVKNRCVFTTHTPVPAGHDQFDYTLARSVLGDIIPENIGALAGADMLNMTQLALNMSRFINGVAKKHGEISRNMFPGYQIDSITNGVHPNSWVSEIWKTLYNRYIPGWALNPERFKDVFKIPDEEYFARHQVAKRALLRFVNHETQAGLDYDLLTIGFGRRATPYKRADLIFSDIDRLTAICEDKVQFIFSGKAHPMDTAGKELIRKIVDVSHILRGKVKIVFIENYDMFVGGLMTAGVDLWLNTPKRPLEASGTSGMKAALNGVPSFSVLDGWWIEGCEEGVTGWSIGPEPLETNMANYDDSRDINDLYDKLEKVIIPKFYNDHSSWLQVMKGAVAKNGRYFNTHRMLREYSEKAYKLKVPALA
jgi:starch phosphorylase